MVDIILILTYLAGVAALGAVAWAVVRQWRLHDHASDTVNGIPSSKITLGVSAFLVVCLLLTFLFGSSAPMLVNGEQFGSSFLLKAADMLINTSLILLVVAVILVVCSNVRNARSRR